MSHHIRQSKKIRTKTIRSTRLRIVIINLGLCAICIVGMFVYMLKIAEATTQGFVMNNLQKELSIIHESVTKSEQRINDLKSVDFIASEAEKLNMVIARDIDYLSPVSGGFALRY